MVEDISDRIRGVVTPILTSMGLELVDLDISGHSKRSHIRVYVDRPGGVSLAEIEQASRFIGHAMDVADPVPTAYTLEVSSPGLDRRLRKYEDYQRAVGKLVRFKLSSPMRGNWVVIGRLLRAQPEELEIRLESGESERVTLEEVAQARLEVEW